jgi:PIN domain nuclease of toxin-antitoxin system
VAPRRASAPRRDLPNPGTLLDTQMLLWAAFEPQRLSAAARQTLESVDQTLYFSLASIWEVALKTSLGRADFHVDPALLQRGVLRAGFSELPIVKESSS